MTNAIDTEHPDYRARRLLWKRYRDLYAGGEQLRANAAEYLIRRQKEPPEVYGERLARVFYENYIGSITDWYVATLFRREPLILVEGDDARARRFLNAFADDCDLRGSSLTEFYRRQILEALVCGVSYTVADFPRAVRPPSTLAEEDEAGTARAYLSACNAEQLINWGMDERGEFEWVVIRHVFDRKTRLDDGPRTRETRWLYYDRQRFQVYQRQELRAGDNAAIELIDEGEHGFAAQNRVPVFPLQLPEGLWLLNKAALLQLEHFNKSNALAWALTLGLFATPVIYSERDWSQVIGDSYYIQLGPNDKFGWTEPEGHVFQVASENLQRLQEEIYRVCYLLTQAGGPLNRGQSGISKLRDYTVTQEVLRVFGDIVKDSMKRVIRALTAARKDCVSVDVSGMDEFDIGDFSGELADAAKLLDLGIASSTLKEQVFKKLAFKYLCDVRQEVKDRIASEIEQGMEVSK